MEKWEIIIVGGGPGGLTAGIYSTRNLRKTLILEKNIPGGQLLSTSMIFNFPSYPEGISGMDLANRMEEQVRKAGVEIRLEEVKKIIPQEKGFILQTPSSEYFTSSIILAMGGKARRLNVPGEEELAGKGVSYCGVCDAPLFRNKKVVVVGGGDTALQESLHLAKFAREIILVHRRDTFRGARILQKEIRKHPRIEVILSGRVEKILGKEKVEGVRINTPEGTKEISCDGVFIFVGFNPSTEIVKDLVDTDPQGYILTDEDMRTSRQGIFACGDVRRKSLKQVVIACGEGAMAGHSANIFLEEL